MSIEAERTLDYFFKLTGIMIEGPTAVIDVFCEALKYFDKDPAAKALNKYMKNGGQLDFTICRPEHAHELAEMLKDEGVVFMETTSMANGGVHMFVFADIDRERVNKVLEKFRAAHELGGISDRSVFTAYSDGNARKIEGLNLVEAKLFEEHAEKRGIPIVIEENGKDQFTMIFAQKDQAAMNRIKADVAIELAGLSGKAITKQIRYENENYINIMNDAACWSEDKPFHAVDLNGSHITVNKYGVEYEGHEGRITVDRKEPMFNERLNLLMNKMRGPVRLSDEEYKKLQESLDQKKFLIQVDIKNGRPVYEKDEYKAVNELIKKKDIYEIKLAMLEPDQAKYDICIENEDMRLATFEEFNDLNEKEDLSYEINPVLLKEMEETLRRFPDQYIDLDTFDNRLEEAILDGRSDLDRYKDDLYWDVVRDKNNNFIPDEYENLSQ